jgi:hypothetical protein
MVVELQIDQLVRRRAQLSSAGEESGEGLAFHGFGGYVENGHGLGIGASGRRQKAIVRPTCRNRFLRARLG